jgi:hypothetical protein
VAEFVSVSQRDCEEFLNHGVYLLYEIFVFGTETLVDFESEEVGRLTIRLSDLNAEDMGVLAADVDVE